MVEEKIRDIVKSMSNLNYMFTDWTRANVDLDFDENKLPVCMYMLPASGSFNLHNGIIRDSPNCVFAFMDLADLDYRGEDNNPTVERMKTKAIEFINKINKSGYFQYIDGNFSYSVIYDKLDQNLTGIVIEIELKEIEGVCLR